MQISNCIISLLSHEINYNVLFMKFLSLLILIRFKKTYLLLIDNKSFDKCGCKY